MRGRLVPASKLWGARGKQPGSLLLWTGNRVQRAQAESWRACTHALQVRPQSFFFENDWFTFLIEKCVCLSSPANKHFSLSKDECDSWTLLRPICPTALSKTKQINSKSRLNDGGGGYNVNVTVARSPETLQELRRASSGWSHPPTPFSWFWRGADSAGQLGIKGFSET
jgi:hypothetical protein